MIPFRCMCEDHKQKCPSSAVICWVSVSYEGWKRGRGQYMVPVRHFCDDLTVSVYWHCSPGPTFAIFVQFQSVKCLRGCKFPVGCSWWVDPSGVICTQRRKTFSYCSSASSAPGPFHFHSAASVRVCFTTPRLVKLTTEHCLLPGAAPLISPNGHPSLSWPFRVAMKWNRK